MGAYFRLNYRQEPASKWPELKAKFFNFLIDHHSEWKSIRNNDPLGYLPYMEVQFERVTGYRLVGLGACMEWIQAGTYYHWVIAQQGQLGRCPRLAGIPPPEGPMTICLYIETCNMGGKPVMKWDELAGGTGQRGTPRCF